MTKDEALILVSALSDENQRLRAEIKFNTPPQRMTNEEIKDLFSSYGQYISGKDYALIRAIEKVTSPQRTWVGLTHAEIDYQAKKDDHGVYFALGALWAEAKLKDKNYD